MPAVFKQNLTNTSFLIIFIILFKNRKHLQIFFKLNYNNNNLIF